MLTLNYSFTLGPFFNAEGSVHNCEDGAVRILGRQGVDTRFNFEVDALIDAEGIGKVK